MARPNTMNTDILTASLGRPIPLAYGRHVVAGNVILKDETDAERTIVFIALGEGEWDGIEELYVNGLAVDITTPGSYHFHKGFHGELSSTGALDPEGVGSLYPFEADGDQKADWLTPPGIQGLTFSRTAYLALYVPFDVFAPGPELDVRGVFRTRKVRIFDAGGVEIGYEYSENPAWQIADLLTRVRGLPDSRVDWASFAAAASYCDTLVDPVGDGTQVKRFLCNVAFTEQVNFDQALLAMLSTCRGLLLDTGGTIKLRIDQARTPVYDFDMNNIVEGTFSATYKDTRELANRLELLFRDTENDLAVMTKLWNHALTASAREDLHDLAEHSLELVEASTEGMKHVNSRLADGRLDQIASSLAESTESTAQAAANVAEATGYVRDILSPNRKGFWRRLLELLIPRPTVSVP